MASNSPKEPPVTKVVAIKDSDTGASPRITAKGEGILAEKLLDIAFTEGVKIRQDSDLTELLSAFDIESPVPLEAIHAVSLILERVYQENNRLQDKQSTIKEPEKEQTQ